MTDYAKVGTGQFVFLALGALIMIVTPIVAAIIWCRKKKEKFTTVLVGAATFLLFAIILEKPIQNVLVFPTQLGLKEHAVSSFLNDRPLLTALVLGLFPGVFEETGRLVAYKTLLRNRKNRETSLSHGIGHGGFEVIFLLGVTYATYFVYGLMINAGTFGSLVEQASALSPEQAGTLYTVAGQIAAVSFADIALAIMERCFAVMFHIGASILVFYACRDKGRFFLYPLAILVHTAMDFVAGVLVLTGLFDPPVWVIEVISGVFGVATFCGGYFLLYRKDRAAE